jgi:LysM repeat protein
MNTTILKTGVNIATSAASANSPLPTASSSEIPRYVRISASVAAHVRLGVAGAVALATDMMVQPGDAITVVVPRGITTVAAIQDSAAGTVNIVPLEDC